LEIAEKSFGARHSKYRVGQFKQIAREVQAHIRGQFNALFFFEIQSMCNLKKFET
jgi:hypothetical protein